ncbi:STAS domain-containing protein [Streptomyces hirsutus]|uniref:STAS domain-containing protein n=1 Tax=Streptomyces hirsutus TaxID=35620 RepID=UPI0006E27480|nr:STAS domain-containing protein [Streptomyces hirsutus]
MPEHEAGGPLGTPTLEVRDFLRRRREQIAQRWADEPLFRTVFTLSRDEAVEAGKAVVDALAQVADSQRVEDSDAAGFTGVREQLGRMSASRSRAGLSITQVSNELASLWPPVDKLLTSELEERPAEELRACTTALSTLMGTLRVVAVQTALSEGQALIDRQRLQLLEVATPVIRLWDGIVAVPLIGTLDSTRSQVVMETLLNAVVDQHARFAILDITGVPTVDSLVAQHLMKTVAAARLMGAECVISGIRPAIAQTMVHLGLDLGSVLTRASLADALGYCLNELGVAVSGPADGSAVRR